MPLPRRPQLGEPFVPSIAREHLLLDTAQKVDELHRAGGNQRPLPSGRVGSVIQVRNNHSATIPAHYPIAVGLPTFDAASPTFTSSVILEGDLPEENAAYAILLEPLSPGTVGKAVVNGYVQAIVRVPAEITAGHWAIVEGSRLTLSTTPGRSPQTLARVHWIADESLEEGEDDLRWSVIEITAVLPPIADGYPGGTLGCECKDLMPYAHASVKVSGDHFALSYETNVSGDDRFSGLMTDIVVVYVEDDDPDADPVWQSDAFVVRDTLVPEDEPDRIGVYRWELLAATVADEFVIDRRVGLLRLTHVSNEVLGIEFEAYSGRFWNVRRPQTFQILKVSCLEEASCNLCVSPAKPTGSCNGMPRSEDEMIVIIDGLPDGWSGQGLTVSDTTSRHATPVGGRPAISADPIVFESSPGKWLVGTRHPIYGGNCRVGGNPVGAIINRDDLSVPYGDGYEATAINGWHTDADYHHWTIHNSEDIEATPFTDTWLGESYPSGDGIDDLEERFPDARQTCDNIFAIGDATIGGNVYTLYGRLHRRYSSPSNWQMSVDLFCNRKDSSSAVPHYHPTLDSGSESSICTPFESYAGSGPSPMWTDHYRLGSYLLSSSDPEDFAVDEIELPLFKDFTAFGGTLELPSTITVRYRTGNEGLKLHPCGSAAGLGGGGGGISGTTTWLKLGEGINFSFLVEGENTGWSTPGGDDGLDGGWLWLNCNVTGVFSFTGALDLTAWNWSVASGTIKTVTPDQATGDTIHDCDYWRGDGFYPQPGGYVVWVFNGTDWTVSSNSAGWPGGSAPTGHTPPGSQVGAFLIELIP